MLHKLEIIIYGKGMEGAPSMGHAEAFDAVRMVLDLFEASYEGENI